MVETLTWSVLDAESTHKCLVAPNVSSIRDVLRAVEDNGDGSFLKSASRSPLQVGALLDLYAHLIMLAKARQLSPVKTSTLVAIIHETHERSMAGRLSRPASYAVLRDLIIKHSVARPPFCAAIFDVGDIHDLDEYILSTYYRHYKMYYYAFVPQQVATVTAVPLGAVTQAPPLSLPPLSTAIAMDEWKERVEERQRTVEEEGMLAAVQDSEALAEQVQRQAGLNGPSYTEGVREQLAIIRDAVSQRSFSRLDAIEEKLSAIEAQVEQTINPPVPPSKSGKKK